MTSSFATGKGLINRIALFLLPLACLLLSTSFKEGRPARPISGTFDIAITVTDPTLPVIHITASGPGTASHLGQAWYESQTDIDYSAPVTELRGDVTFTAANGDELYTSFVGHPTPYRPGIEMIVRQFTITGGTGRFEGATGSFTGTTISPSPASPGELPGTSHITIKGMITY